jgi:ABC-type amino acid transport substrate-binding protein
MDQNSNQPSNPSQPAQNPGQVPPSPATPPPTPTTPPPSDTSNSTGTTPPQPPQQTPAPQNPPPPAPESQKKSPKLLYFLIFFILLFLSGLAFAIWYFQSQLQQQTAATNAAPQVAETQIEKLVVGTDPTYEPMEYMENNTMVGYDIDLANLLGQELGAKVEIKNITFDSLFPSLESKEIDVIISAVTITDERKQKYDFSKEYLNAGQVIITAKTDTTISSPENLRGKRIAVQRGTTNETEALKYTDPALVVRSDDFEQATKALVEGQADAMFTDLPNAKGIIVANPTLKIASDPFVNQYYGIVLRKGDLRLKEVNAALESLRVKGILTELKQKWLD